MEVEIETTNPQPTAKGQQDREEGAKSSKMEEDVEESVFQKDKPTEQQATKPVLDILDAEEARGDNHSKINPDTSSSRVTANAQPVLEQTHKSASITSHLKPLPVIESNNDPSPTRLATDPGLSEYKAKVPIEEEGLKAVNARFEILQYHFSYLREELQECSREDPAGVFEGIKERLEAIAAAIKTNPVRLEHPNSKSSFNPGKPLEAGSSKSVSFTNLPERRDQFCPENSPVKAEKAILSVFSKLVSYTSFFGIFKKGESSPLANLRSTGSKTDTTSPTNPRQPSPKKCNKANTQKSPEENSATIALRELALTTLRQNNLILAKLNLRQSPLTSSSSCPHLQPVPPSVPTENRTTNNIPLIILYTANILLFLTFLIAIAWALAAGLMADRERRMWLAGGETARIGSVILQPEGGFWEKGWGVGAGGWVLGGDVEGFEEGVLLM